MGWLNSLFGNKNGGGGHSDQSLPWIPLESSEQLDELIRKSGERPQVIFKHSITCGVSSMAIKQFAFNYGASEKNMDIHLLDVRRYREVSNLVAQRFGIVHESPQILVIRDGKVVNHASHAAIGGVALDR